MYLILRGEDFYYQLNQLSTKKGKIIKQFRLSLSKFLLILIEIQKA